VLCSFARRPCQQLGEEEGCRRNRHEGARGLGADGQPECRVLRQCSKELALGSSIDTHEEQRMYALRHLLPLFMHILLPSSAARNIRSCQ
jgi:hypothetical protein